MKHWRECTECKELHCAPNPKQPTCSRKCGYARVARLLTKHGESCGNMGWRGATREYNTWANMRDRCNNANNEEYPNYGGRGIFVCGRWENYQSFLSDMGRKPRGTSLDRIDVNGNYEPSNCRWADAHTQARNQRDAVLLTYNGKTLKTHEWSAITGLSVGLINNRRRSGWSDERILTQPFGVRIDSRTVNRSEWPKIKTMN